MRERKVQDIWKQMDALHAESTPSDPGITVTEYATRYKMTQELAYKRLARLAKDGRLVAGWRLIDGHKARVFRFPESA